MLKTKQTKNQNKKPQTFIGELGIFTQNCWMRNWNRDRWGSHLMSWIPQRLVCTGESVDYRSYTASGTGKSNTASGTDPFSGSRHPGTFPARGEVPSWEDSDCRSKWVSHHGSQVPQWTVCADQICGGCGIGLQKGHSFWKRQKQHSFWDRAYFGHQTSSYLPCQRKGVHPGGLWLPEKVRESSWVLGPSETSLHRWECWLKKLHSYWDRQKWHSFLDKPHFRLQKSGHFPCQRRGALPRRTLTAREG
jgi:hypothetical protein